MEIESIDGLSKDQKLLAKLTVTNLQIGLTQGKDVAEEEVPYVIHILCYGLDLFPGKHSKNKLLM